MITKGLLNKKLFGFASDVFTEEPWRVKEFAHNLNVILSPHIGAHTNKAKNRLSLETLQVWSDFVYKQQINNNINSKFTHYL